MVAQFVGYHFLLCFFFIVGYLIEHGFIACPNFVEFPRKHLSKSSLTNTSLLKQGNIMVGKYAAKFEELLKFWPYYGVEDGNNLLSIQE